MMATTSTAEEVSRSAAEPSMFSHVNCEGKSGVSSSFRGLREIRCQGNPVSRKIRGKSGVSSSFLPEKMNRHRAKKARERCVGLSAISSLLQEGDSRVMSLGHPSYPRPKGTRNHSMAEKRGYVEIGETGP